jgi:hypothetical protein
MATNLSREPLTVTDNSIAAINVVLARIQEQLELLAGLRGQVTVQAPLTLAGGSVAATDAARLQDVLRTPVEPFAWILP